MPVELCINNENNEKELKAAFLKQSFILESMNRFSNDAIVILNAQKKIISCSEKFCAWFADENPLGQRFFPLMKKIVHLPDDFLKEKSYFLKWNESEPERVLKAQISTYNNEKGSTDRYLIILKDVTEEQEMQAQKDNFIATLTHDLKTPLRADILSLELLLKGRFGEINNEQREILEEMLKSNKFMMSMIDTLLTKYKYENSKVILNRNLINVNNLTEDCAKELKMLFDERKVTLKLELSPQKLEVSADLIEIKRALSNLISNAIKFNKENGLVIISTSVVNGFVAIKVQDTGIGMNEEKMEHIFDKYVSYAKRFRRLGTGLGLYVSKKIAEAHQGKIDVISEPNVGSTFTLMLPMFVSENEKN